MPFHFCYKVNTHKRTETNTNNSPDKILQQHPFPNNRNKLEVKLNHNRNFHVFTKTGGCSQENALERLTSCLKAKWGLQQRGALLLNVN